MMMPMNNVMAITPSISRVVAALRDFGFWKAGTPLLIASTPVSAAQPEENARATRKTRAIAASPRLVLGVHLELGGLGLQRIAEHDRSGTDPSPA